MSDARLFMQRALELAVVEGHMKDLHRLEDPAQIPVLAENAAPIPLPAFSTAQFHYLSREELQQRANARGTHVYYVVVRAIRRDGDVVVLHLDKPALEAEFVKGQRHRHLARASRLRFADCQPGGKAICGILWRSD
jgi:hypothetical protein